MVRRRECAEHRPPPPNSGRKIGRLPTAGRPHRRSEPPPPRVFAQNERRGSSGPPPRFLLLRARRAGPRAGPPGRGRGGNVADDGSWHANKRGSCGILATRAARVLSMAGRLPPPTPGGTGGSIPARVLPAPSRCSSLPSEPPVGRPRRAGRCGRSRSRTSDERRATSDERRPPEAARRWRCGKTTGEARWAVNGSIDGWM